MDIYILSIRTQGCVMTKMISAGWRLHYISYGGLIIFLAIAFWAKKVFLVTCWKKLAVGNSFSFISFLLMDWCIITSRMRFNPSWVTFTLCQNIKKINLDATIGYLNNFYTKSAIKSLGLGPKIRVSQRTSNTYFLLPYHLHWYKYFTEVLPRTRGCVMALN